MYDDNQFYQVIEKAGALAYSWRMVHYALWPLNILDEFSIFVFFCFFVFN